MKKIATITASVITAGVLCYLGCQAISGITTVSVLKKNDVRPRRLPRIIKSSLFNEKVATIATRPRRSVPFTPLFRCQTADGL